MTTTRVYTSADSGALQLTGETGKLNDILYQCLVTGSGLSQDPLGWARDYTGTDKAVYRAPEGTRLPFRLQDDGPGGGTYKEARIYGAESFSDVDTPTNRFPTAAQATNGIFVRKSNTADATTRPWVLIGDERTLYFAALTGDAGSTYLMIGFGEFYSFKASDTYGSLLIARPTENSSTVTSAAEPMDDTTIASGTLGGHYLCRDTAHSVGAIAFGKHGNRAQSTTALIGLLVAPNTPNSKYYSSAINITHTSGGNQLRGRLRGLRHFHHSLTAVSDRYTLSGAGDLAGRNFLILEQLGSGGVALFDTGIWEHN